MIFLDHPRTALALGVCRGLWNEHCAWEVHLSQTDEQKHRALSDDLVDALMYGTHEEILGILTKLEYLDGEAFNIVVRLICGDKKLRSLFQNRLLVVRWSAGKPKNLASTPHGESYIISVLQAAARRGKQQKGAVASLMADFKVSRSVIMRAWSKRLK
jgi:hypothetical protein